MHNVRHGEACVGASGYSVNHHGKVPACKGLRRPCDLGTSSAVVEVGTSFLREPGGLVSS